MPPPPPESLPVGFRFRPTDEELVRHYLKPKIAGRAHPDLLLIPDVDLSACEPWELPAKALIRSEDAEWFFFAPLDRKYPGGHRSNRSTAAGYWKATGKDRLIRSRPQGTLIGIKKTLVFHRGRAPRGHRTAWIMHEYRTAEPQLQQGQKGSFVLYRLFDKHEEEEEPEASDAADSPSTSSPVDPRPMKLAVKPENLSQAASAETAHLLTTLSTNEPAAAQEGDPLLDELAQLPDLQPEQTCDGFPTITSPLRPYTDYPFLGNVPFLGDVGGQDLSAYIDSIMAQKDLEDLFNNVVEPARTDMADSDAFNGLEGWAAEPSNSMQQLTVSNLTDPNQGTAARRIRLVHSIQRASVTDPVLITSNLEVEDETGSCYRAGSSSTNDSEDYSNAGGAMHSQGGGQIASSMEVTEELQDLMFEEEVDGAGLPHGDGGNLKRRLKQECSEDVVQHGKGKPSSRRRGSSVVRLPCLAVGFLVLAALVTTSSRYLAGLIT